MSNYLAIATVTIALRDLLQDAALSAVPGAVVTTQQPEQVQAAEEMWLLFWDQGCHQYGPSSDDTLYYWVPESQTIVMTEDEE